VTFIISTSFSTTITLVAALPINVLMGAALPAWML
jgi:hypothetical protein